ncbi:MAG: ATP-dependent helicase, partial [Spirochaetota bacterium]
KLFEEFPEVRNYYRDLFDYIMVDEFQDTNYSQYLLIKMLSRSKNISVVGDDDQSIYSWRGADISNIIDRFPKDFPESRLVKLEQNYRSTNTILNAANSLITKNSNRFPKNLWSNLGEGEKLIFYSAEMDKDEAIYVGNNIKKIMNEYKGENLAVFYRMNFQSRNFEEILRKMKIPYKIFGGIKFYERKEIKDLIAYMRVIANSDDSISLKRIINLPKRSIGKKTIEKIEELSQKYYISFFDAIEYGCEENIYGKSTKSKLMKFVKLISELKEAKEQKKISELFKYLVEKIDYEKYLKNESGDNSEFEDRKANIEELLRGIINFEQERINIMNSDEDEVPFDIPMDMEAEEPTLENYLMEINLQTDIDELDEEKGYVSLMTIHKSKGLEFDTVFVSGCDEGILPHYMNMQLDPSALEEERRLFYVALTRARKRLYLSSAGLRYSFGRPNDYEVSSFISELNRNYVEADLSYSNKHQDRDWEVSFSTKKRKAKNMYKTITKPNNNIITDINSISVNDMLYHPNFGKVIVKEIRNNQAIDSIIVRDQQGNIRNLILKYAKLSKSPY